MKFLQFIQKAVYIIAIALGIYVFFMLPAGDPSAPVAGQEQQAQAGTVQKFNMYTYLNGVKSSRGKMELDFDFKFDNGDKMVVKTTQNFETKGKSSSIIGSTIWNMNGDGVVIDDKTYIIEGVRYSKTNSGYVKNADNRFLDAGNLNISKIEESLEKSESLMKEDNISCYKYTTTLTYADMSNDLRTYVRNLGVNVADIDNLNLDITMFVTDKNLPYKVKIEFSGAKCTVKANELSEKSCRVDGEVVITFSGFNGVEGITLPEEAKSASDGTYVFTDKLNRYLRGLANTRINN